MGRPPPTLGQVAGCYGKEEENMCFAFFIIKRGHSLGRQNPLAESISVSMVNSFRQL